MKASSPKSESEWLCDDDFDDFLPRAPSRTRGKQPDLASVKDVRVRETDSEGGSGGEEVGAVGNLGAAKVAGHSKKRGIVKGSVTFTKSTPGQSLVNPWRVRGPVRGKRRHIGYYATEKEGKEVLARANAAEALHGHYPLSHPPPLLASGHSVCSGSHLYIIRAPSRSHQNGSGRRGTGQRRLGGIGWRPRLQRGDRGPARASSCRRAGDGNVYVPEIFMSLEGCLCWLVLFRCLGGGLSPPDVGVLTLT